jgi:serine/threonine protein kinase
MTEPRKVGRWTLHERLGRPGGNADVFRATSDDGEEVALKIIDAKPHREPYKRFVHEIRTLRGLADMTGILPVLDSYLPERPSNTDRPWLAMPIAEPLDVALLGQPLELIVEAVATIASTLARLHAEGIAHRDVKPPNLFRLNGSWLVGDFGLVATPEPSGLTIPGQKLGPAHFTAYEMIVDATTADPKAADVFSIAKTLWALARDQPYPPDGHQRAGTRGFEVADTRPHLNAHLLDELIDRSTLIHPESRPSMEQFAADLRRWLALKPANTDIDVSDLRAQFRAKVEASLAAEDVAEHRKDQAIDAVRRLNELLAPLNRALVELHPRAVIDGAPDQFTQNVIRTMDTFGSAVIVWRNQRLSQIALDDRRQDYSLRFGRALELTDDGELILHMAILVGATRTMGGVRFQWMPDAWLAPVGSIEAEDMLREAVQEAAPKLREAIIAFAEYAPA